MENGRNYALTSAVDSHGNVLVGGSSTIEIVTNAQGYAVPTLVPTLLKYDANGALLWSFQHDHGVRSPHREDYWHPIEGGLSNFTGGYGEFTKVLVDAQNNIYALGTVPGSDFTSDATETDIAVFKLDANGNRLWSRILPAAGVDEVLQAGISASGNLLIAYRNGTSYSESASMNAVAINSSNGATLWNRSHELEKEMRVAAVSSNKVALALDGSYEGGNPKLIVYDEQGNIQTTAEFPGESELPQCFDALRPLFCGAHALVGLVFMGDDLLVTRHQVGVDSPSDSVLHVTRLGANGQTVWETDVAQPDTRTQENLLIDYIDGVRESLNKSRKLA